MSPDYIWFEEHTEKNHSMEEIQHS